METTKYERASEIEDEYGIRLRMPNDAQTFHVAQTPRVLVVGYVVHPQTWGFGFASFDVETKAEMVSHSGLYPDVGYDCEFTEREMTFFIKCVSDEFLTGMRGLEGAS